MSDGNDCILLFDPWTLRCPGEIHEGEASLKHWKDDKSRDIGIETIYIQWKADPENGEDKKNWEAEAVGGELWEIPSSGVWRQDRGLREEGLAIQPRI